MSGAAEQRNPNPWRPLIICSDGHLAAETEAAVCQGLPGSCVAVESTYPEPAALPELIARHGCDLCFLDFSVNPVPAFDLLAAMQSAPTPIAVVALVPQGHSDLLLRCLRQGAHAFLLCPPTADQVSKIAERLPNTSDTANAHPSSTVICVMPVKGSCGATTIATNLAYQLKKSGAKRVLLADLDPLTGIIGFLWKLKSSYSFMDALHHGGVLDADVWKGVIVPSQGIDVLLAPESPVHDIDDGLGPSTLVDFARQQYDYIVVDTSGPYGDWSIQLARLADRLFLVAANEPLSPFAVRRASGYLKHFGAGGAKMRLILNRTRPDAVGDASRNYEMEPAFVLPHDRDAVNKALVDGRAITASCAFTKQLGTLAARMVGGKEPAPPQAKKSAGLAGLFSLFGRRGS
ncbi:MAG: AAA family ATPase [Bryobacteraceae bacterium]